MIARNIEQPYSGAEAAVAVAERGLHAAREAKRAWLELVATLPGPDSGSARTSWAAARVAPPVPLLVVEGGCERTLAPSLELVSHRLELSLDPCQRVAPERQP